MISGSTGLIGKFLIDVIMYKNKVDNLNCKVIDKRFPRHRDSVT